MVDTHDGAREYFGERILDELVGEWKSSGTTEVIAQAELLPVALAKNLWAERMRDRRVFFFIDNEGAKFQCISFRADLCTAIGSCVTLPSWK